MSPAVQALIESLIQSGLILFSDADNNKHDLTKLGALIPLIGSVTTAITEVNATLTQAQAESWAEDDARWLPIFEKAEAALKQSLERLN